MQVLSERPYYLTFPSGHKVWISDFALSYREPQVSFEIDAIQERFEAAFLHIWLGEVESDKFNQLILSAGLTWRQVSILRAYAKYFKQIGLPFSQEYIETAFVRHTTIAQACVTLFETRFNPALVFNKTTRLQRVKHLTPELFRALNAVTNLDEDKIFRHYISVINATLRTNFYQRDPEGRVKPTISFKLNSREIPGLPKPYPLYEIYVYSPRLEGVHLRGGKLREEAFVGLIVAKIFAPKS